ncbi:hypothetical protein D3C83_307940 [compost metagenome]
MRTLVRIGIRRQGEVEILGGLAEGDQVVVGGAQKVRNGSRVQITQESVAEG